MRKLLQNPKKILSPHIKEGMLIIDIGSAMGYFSIPMAQMVGDNGKLICVDLQDKMIKKLEKRAKKAGLIDRIELRVCNENSLTLEDLNGKADFALAFAVVHEMPDVASFFSQVYAVLNHGGRLLIAEPKGHLEEEMFKEIFSLAEKHGFKIIEQPNIAQSRTVLLEK